MLGTAERGVRAAYAVAGFLCMLRTRAAFNY